MADPNSELRERVKRFSLLRAAQRALTRCIHPAALDPLREQGRRLLIRIEAIDWGDDASFAEIDALLDENLAATLELVEKLEFFQLRVAGPVLRRDKPEDMLALVDVMLLGNLAENRVIRLLEYMITMLCAEDEDGRRNLARQPHELTEELDAAGRRQAADSSFDAGAAVSRLEESARGLMRDTDHRVLRDEIRRYKQQLGVCILHPSVLVAAVEYNIAMANQVSARIDSTLAIDQLADDLLAELKEPAEGDFDLLSGEALQRLAAALRNRVQLAPCQDEVAGRVAAALKIDGLQPREVEALECNEDVPVEQLIVSSVLLGCILRQRSALTEELAELGLDPEQLEKSALPALLREMSAASSKFFADSAYAEAFELAEVKMRNLATLASAVGRRARSGGVKEETSGSDGLLPRGLMPSVQATIAGLIAVVVVGVLVLLPGERQVGILSDSELAEISPFLVTGHHRLRDGEQLFVGHLFPTWEYLGNPEREAAATEIGSHFLQRGVENVVLLGEGRRVMARWESGKLALLAPKAPVVQR